MQCPKEVHTPIETTEKIKVSGGEKVDVLGITDVEINATANAKKPLKKNLESIIHVKSQKVNLISLPRLLEKDFVIKNYYGYSKY